MGPGTVGKRDGACEAGRYLGTGAAPGPSCSWLSVKVILPSLGAQTAGGQASGQGEEEFPEPGAALG